ncbi:MAG: glutathione S-transferase family protein [Sedimentitalea sp.]
MLTLLTFPANFGQFSVSSFCVKAALLLQVSGQKWQRQDMDDPRKMPFGKLPVLKTEQRLIADSDAIADWLTKQGADFDAGLSDLDKARGRALTRMAEEHMYFHMAYDRWCNDAVWPTVRNIYFDAIPRILRKPITNGLRKNLMRGLNVLGLSRLSDDQRFARLEQDLQVITAHLNESPFLLGPTPSMADYSVAPVIAGLRTTPVQTRISQRIENDQLLCDYLARLEAAVPLP